MSEKTTISYADHTWSPWRGCEKVSEGCSNCYAEALAKRGGVPFGHGQPRTLTKDWKKPLRWNKQAAAMSCGDCDPCVGGVPSQCAVGPYKSRVFVSLCDWLDDQVPIEWLANFLKLIHDTPNLTWILSTKRPENFMSRTGLCASDEIHKWLGDWRTGNPPTNVWFGITCENQLLFIKRTEHLLSIPAKVKWWSFEPLLGPINFEHLGDGLLEATLLNRPGLWSVVGGESGPHRRTCEIEWIAQIALDCKLLNIPCWVKQDSALRSGAQGRIPGSIWNIKELPKR